MTNSVKTDIILSLVSIAYYWMGEQNQQAAEAVTCLIKQLDVDDKMKKKISDLDKDIHTFFHCPADYEIPIHVKIPENKDEEHKVLWVSGVCLMNLFKSGNFELGYTMLMDMSINWNELYKSVIDTLKNNNDIKNELGSWLMAHFFMACDLLGTNEIKMLGFTVKKEQDF